MHSNDRNMFCLSFGTLAVDLNGTATAPGAAIKIFTRMLMGTRSLKVLDVACRDLNLTPAAVAGSG